MATADTVIADRYRLIARVGRGATGEVFKAEDLSDASAPPVAVKLVDLEDCEDDVADLQREITTLAQCSSPYVTKYLSSALVEGTSKLAIVMEYMAGGSARHVADERKAHDGVNGLDEGEIRCIIRDVLHALEYLHAEGKIHRDIKAANVLLTERGEARLADFGVSGQMTHTLGARRKTFTGTPFWMAPEVIQGGEGYDEKADIWSLGITCYELATGAAPHAELHPMRVLFVIPKQDPPRLPESGRFSDEFRDFVAQCLQKDPDARPSARELSEHPFAKRTRDAAAETSLRARVAKHVALTDSTLDGDVGGSGADASTTAAVTPSKISPTKVAPAWDFGDDTLGRKFASKENPTPVAPETSFNALPHAGDDASEYGGSSIYQSMGGTIRMTKPPTLPDEMNDEESDDFGSMGDATIGTTSSRGGAHDKYKLDEILEQTVTSAPLMRSLIAPAMESIFTNNEADEADEAVAAAVDRATEALDALELVSPGSLAAFVQSIMRELAGTRDESLRALRSRAQKYFGGAGEERATVDGGRSVLANYLLHRWRADVDKRNANR